MRYITIIAPKGCGKTTLAELINEEIKNSKIVSFAAPLHDILSNYYSLKQGLNKEELKDNINCNISYRKASEAIGKCFRTLNEKWLINIFLKECDHIANKDINTTIIVDDCRLESELRLMLSMNSFIILLEQENYVPFIGETTDTEWMAQYLIASFNHNDHMGICKELKEYPYFKHYKIPRFKTRKELSDYYLNNIIRKTTEGEPVKNESRI